MLANSQSSQSTRGATLRATRGATLRAGLSSSRQSPPTPSPSPDAFEGLSEKELVQIIEREQSFEILSALHAHCYPSCTCDAEPAPCPWCNALRAIIIDVITRAGKSPFYLREIIDRTSCEIEVVDRALRRLHQAGFLRCFEDTYRLVRGTVEECKLKLASPLSCNCPITIAPCNCADYRRPGRLLPLPALERLNNKLAEFCEPSLMPALTLVSHKQALVVEMAKRYRDKTQLRHPLDNVQWLNAKALSEARLGLLASTRRNGTVATGDVAKG